MASVERTAYPRFKPSLSGRELEVLYEPAPLALAFTEENTRSPRGRLTLLAVHDAKASPMEMSAPRVTLLVWPSATRERLHWQPSK